MDDKRMMIEAVRGGFQVSYGAVCGNRAVCTTVAEVHAFVEEIFGEGVQVQQAAPNQEDDHASS